MKTRYYSDGCSGAFSIRRVRDGYRVVLGENSKKKTYRTFGEARRALARHVCISAA